MNTVSIIALVASAILGVSGICSLIYSLTKHRVVTDITVSKSEEKYNQVDKNKVDISDHETRIADLESGHGKIVKSLKEMRDESRVADRLLVRAMVEILDNRVTGNNVENLKATKKELMLFLQDH